MTVVAMWCRHEEDNLIGIGGNIPWRIQSDIERFRKVVEGQTVVCGRKTYESFPNRTLNGCQMFVMTADMAYEVSDTEHHRVISGQKMLADFEEDIYVVGGAEIYELFMTGKEKLKPQIVVDCVYRGDAESLEGKRINICKSIAVLEQKYRKITPDYCVDDVAAAIWVRKGEFVEQSVLRRLVGILEEGAVIA